MRHLPGVKAIARGSRRSSGSSPSGGDVLQGSDLAAPPTRFQARVSAHRRVAFGSVSLNDVKKIKNTFGCTVNDVVIAMCAAGLRRWLDERGELPAEPAGGALPSRCEPREQVGTFGNRVSVMIVELPTHWPTRCSGCAGSTRRCAPPRSATTRCRRR